MDVKCNWMHGGVQPQGSDSSFKCMYYSLFMEMLKEQVGRMVSVVKVEHREPKPHNESAGMLINQV